MKDIIFNLIYKINIPENNLFRISALFLCSFIIVFSILVLIKGDLSLDDFLGDSDGIGLGIMIILVIAFFGVSEFFIIKYIENIYEYIFIAIGIITALFNIKDDNIKKTFFVALIFFFILLYAAFFNAPSAINDAAINNQNITNNYTNDLKSTLSNQKAIAHLLLGYNNLFASVLLGDITLKDYIIISLIFILSTIIIIYIIKRIEKRKPK
ncbi:hypothetical protein A966_05798 [Brachyspira hampsonii 30446]|uniref:Uncharacterized protein n=1 Tax=Brachyspira hampsonii 30446 TaxID=1289135 RepID=A0A2U4FQA9_9SPIR|nr:hypothetical protein [Brachyspira hampsonii]EKV57363.1 hypothetical protein A966_05798 [Brachyspira hampsonii 30446]MBW5396109.1 hypothetical protein [Brachyspira hampsonii]OEJ19036.1 hypothetical protein A9495_00365 [Brachyspira hampsonii]